MRCTIARTTTKKIWKFWKEKCQKENEDNTNFGWKREESNSRIGSSRSSSSSIAFLLFVKCVNVWKRRWANARRKKWKKAKQRWKRIQRTCVSAHAFNSEATNKMKSTNVFCFFLIRAHRRKHENRIDKTTDDRKVVVVSVEWTANVIARWRWTNQRRNVEDFVVALGRARC